MHAPQTSEEDLLERLWQVCFQAPTQARQQLAAWEPTTDAERAKLHVIRAMLFPTEHAPIVAGALVNNAAVQLTTAQAGPAWAARMAAVTAKAALAHTPFWSPPSAVCDALLGAISPILNGDDALDRGLAHHALASVAFRKKENVRALALASRAEADFFSTASIRLQHQITLFKGTLLSRLGRFSHAASAYVSALQISAQHPTLFTGEEAVRAFGNVVITIWKMGHVDDVAAYAEWLSAHFFATPRQLPMRLALVSIAAFHRATKGDLAGALSLVETRLAAGAIPGRYALLRSMLLAMAGRAEEAEQALSAVPSGAPFARAVALGRAHIATARPRFQPVPGIEDLAASLPLPLSPIEHHILAAYSDALTRAGAASAPLAALLQRQHEVARELVDTLEKQSVILDLKLRLSRGESLLLRDALEKADRALNVLGGRQRLELELAAGFHDINNRFQVVLAELAYASAPASPAAQRSLFAAQEAIVSASRLNRNLLAAVRGSQQPPAPLQRVRIRAVLDGAEPYLRGLTRDTVALQLRLHSDAWIRCRSEQIQDVLLNLVKNAVESMPGGGTLRIEAAERAGWLRVTVTDDGPGVPPELLPRLFEPFVTSRAHSGGTGIGLWHAREVLRAHGGNLTLEPSQDGAVFMMTLPCA